MNTSRFARTLTAFALLVVLIGSGRCQTSALPYERLEGTIGGLPVVVNLGPQSSYYYVKVGQTIGLGVQTPTADSLLAFKWLSGIDQSATWKTVRHPDGSITGSWYSDTTTPRIWSDAKQDWVDGKPRARRVLPISLHPAYPEGSYRFVKYSIDDSLVREIRNGYTGRVNYSIDATLPAPGWSGGDRLFYNSEIAKETGCGGDADLRDCWDVQSRDYRDSSIAEIIDFASDMADSDLATMYGPLNYYESDMLSPRYNTLGILSLDLFSEEYTGGAHPNHGTTLVVLDMQQHRRVQLHDVISARDREMRPIVEEYFRKEHGLPKGAPLTAILFEDHLDINDNFYLTDKGLGFLYQPYEVSAYAYGEVEVFIPFSALKGKLTEWAVKRFGL